MSPPDARGASATLPALDPWSEEVRFLPVPDDGRAHWLVPKPMPSGEWWGLSSLRAPEAKTMTRAEYQSPALGWRGWIFRDYDDEERLLVAIEAWILFVAWLARSTAQILLDGASVALAEPLDLADDWQRAVIRGRMSHDKAWRIRDWLSAPRVLVLSLPRPFPVYVVSIDTEALASSPRYLGVVITLERARA
jgi:hypothetical protein